MSAGNWILRGMQSMRGLNFKRGDAAAKVSGKPASVRNAGAAATADRSKAGPADAPADRAARTTRERLTALLKREEEALSPRLLRRISLEMEAIVDSQLSEVEAGRRALALAEWYGLANAAQRRDVWLLMSENFGPKSDKIRAARDAYESAIGTVDETQAEIRMRRAFMSPRTRLLQRFAVFPEGMRFLVDLRAELLPHLKADKRLLALDAELEHLFTNWFDVAFLELRRISWDSPASLIEKLIQYEAVHAIKSWADLKNRLDSDRRCYGFFHPRLPNEPLIFVEVALVDELASAISPLLDESAAASDLERATTAIFYSISNTQTGLRGVSFGDSLIKRVVETLHNEFPRLKTFATLSPIPGFRPWLGQHAAELLGRLDTKAQTALAKALQLPAPNAPAFLAAAENVLQLDEKSPVRGLLMQAAAEYLGRQVQDGKPLDAVARFHLGNGARVECLNWAGDLSPKGLRQSYGLMVNYLYDLKRLDKHRSQLSQGKIPVSSRVQGLYI